MYTIISRRCAIPKKESDGSEFRPRLGGETLHEEEVKIRPSRGSVNPSLALFSDFPDDDLETTGD